ncbi:NUDIX hydrolase [Betaproteobacteria bacterium]|nr:NUDIX hydrolase [Betaproteobacteria bacterium]
MHKYEKNGKLTNISLEEKSIGSTKIFEGIFLNLYQDDVITADNQKSVREYFKHPGAVAILPFLNEEKLLIERQWRFPIRQEIFEFPAGKIDRGESPLVTAKRELLEETGYIAKSWCKLGELLPVPAYSNEKIFLFCAKDLILKTGQNTEPGECINLVYITIEDFLAKVQNLEIIDAKTIALAFWLLRIRDKTIKMNWEVDNG